MNEEQVLWKFLSDISIEINKIAEREGKQAIAVGKSDPDLAYVKQNKIEQCEKILEKLQALNSDP